MAVYAIGDIHGCLTALKTLFKNLRINENDHVVFLGDYVDRGPDSKGVIDWLIENGKKHHFTFLKGNHEIMMLESRKSRETLTSWLGFGGHETLLSYGINNDSQWQDLIPAAHWEFLKNCKHYFEIESYIFVHGGLELGKPLHQQSDHYLFWKKFVTPELYIEDRTVICGHTSRKNGEVADFGHTICIDTYAYGGKWLTCLNAETNEILQANNKGEIRF